jgi:hypothetical protein
MNRPQLPRARASGALVRAALRLYPAAWRARYGDEVLAYLDDSGADLRTVVGLAGLAIPARIWPARHLYDRPARMRASLATVLAAWTALTGVALVFAQLTQAQGFTPAGHPVVQWSYWVFDAAVPVSVVAVAIGGLPLWLLMMRRARREHSRRDMAYLLAPVAVPAGYAALAVTILKLAPHSPGQGIGPAWFGVLVALGLAAGGLFAAGPTLALRRLRPRGPAVTVAVAAAGTAAAAISLAGLASAVAAIGLYRWAPHYAGYHQAWPLGLYLPPVLVAIATAIISATRGIRLTRSAALP